MTSWTVKDLEYWDERIQEEVQALGLSCFPQEFEVCDHNQMLGYMAYSGMPAHYPHWSYGKSFERHKTLYDYGVSGLPYEMVINSNPSLAYLMKDNSLCLQILTIAHVYGHNDFFKNNFTFHHSRPELTLPRFKNNAERVRSYIEDPSIGLDKVEDMLDAAHALAFQCRRNLAIKKLSQEEQQERALEGAAPPEDPYRRIHPPNELEEPDLRRLPLEPEEDLLLFIRDHNPYLAAWQQDLLTIVHQRSQYFLPQIETKIMNEGWASYWHHSILNRLELPPELHMEFLVHHSQVLRPHLGQINPYHLGFVIWQDLRRRVEEGDDDAEEESAIPSANGAGSAKMFEVREVDRDVSFLRRFLTFDLMRELDMFRYEQKGGEYVVREVADEDHWQNVKQALLASVGTASMPVVRIEDADYEERRVLLLSHAHEGRDLELEYAEKTLGYLYKLWGRKVVLETVLREKPHFLTYDEEGFEKEERE